jgi:O-antigen/teichoic acid export membrane protein
MASLFVPLYVRYMGIESWGLVGMFATFQTVLALLDVGLSSTLNREMARLSAIPGRYQEMRDLVRTLEVMCWGAAAVAMVVVAGSSQYIARHWVKAAHLPPTVIGRVFLIMAFVIALQLPIGFYSGGLMGLQKQVLLNVINAAVSILRGAGAVFILGFISSTVTAFFLWQITVSAIHVPLLATALWRQLPHGETQAAFRKAIVRGIWRFTAGMSFVAVLAVTLTQLDKIVLSKIVPIAAFGYYALASMVAMSLSRLFTPMFYSIYPQFTQLAARGDLTTLTRVYHGACQCMAVLILPVATVIALFSHEILLLWTRDATMASQCYLLVSVLIAGTAINGLMNLPYALQLAFGWTALSVVKNVIALAIMVPFIIYMTHRYGVLGAAMTWLVLNVGYLVFEIPAMHRRLLPAEKWHWYGIDVALPLVACISVAGLGRFLIRGTVGTYLIVQNLMIVSTLTLVATAAATPFTRLWVFTKVRQYASRPRTN